MYLIIAAAVTLALLFYILSIRPKDLPAPELVIPWRHLEVRKSQIYENLRDVAFEYRVGKLSDQDYQRTKTELQTELAGVLAAIDALKQAPPAKAAKPATAKSNGSRAAAERTCPHCGASFDRDLKFCGECGKPMQEATA